MSCLEYVLVSGGNINHFILSNYINNCKNNKDNYVTDNNNDNNEVKIIAIDKGIETLHKLKIKPDYILGDFDSVDKDVYIDFIKLYSDVSILRYNSKKDYTDTELGVRISLERHANKITIFGATGTRIDHMLANIRILYLAHKEGVFAQIIDENNRIYLGENFIEIDKENIYGKYISIIPYKDQLSGVTMKGFKYDIKNAIMQYEASLGVSNEIVADKASIKCDEGIFIIIESKD